MISSAFTIKLLNVCAKRRQAVAGTTVLYELLAPRESAHQAFLSFIFIEYIRIYPICQAQIMNAF
jgi:hypothetical protein